MIRRLAAWLLRATEPPIHDLTHPGASSAELLRNLPAASAPVKSIPRCGVCESSFVQAEGTTCFRCEARAAKREEAPSVIPFAGKSAGRRRRRS